MKDRAGQSVPQRWALHRAVFGDGEARVATHDQSISVGQWAAPALGNGSLSRSLVPTSPLLLVSIIG